MWERTDSRMEEDLDDIKEYLVSCDTPLYRDWQDIPDPPKRKPGQGDYYFRHRHEDRACNRCGNVVPVGDKQCETCKKRVRQEYEARKKALGIKRKKTAR